MVTQEELAAFLVDRGLAEEHGGYGHATGEAVAEELLSAFTITASGEAPATSELSPRDQIREELARELWDKFRNVRPSMGEPMPYQSGFYAALTDFIGELEARTPFRL